MLRGKCVYRGKIKYGGIFHDQTSKEFIFEQGSVGLKATNLYWAALSPDAYA